MNRPHDNLDRLDRSTSDLMTRSAIPLLRIALGTTYLWFGALKLAGASPVDDLVGKMSFGLPKGLFVKIMGIWESALGVALLLRLAMRFTLVLYFLQLAGTFMVFVAHPRQAYRNRNPLLLTRDGEFIVKNLVLLAAGFAVGGTVRHGTEDIPSLGQRAANESRGVHA